MGHDEAGQIYRSDELILTNQTALAPGKVGRIILSGSKLNFDNGTAWEVVSST